MSTPRLKYNPKAYKRIAEIYAWLADGKNVQMRRTGIEAKTFGNGWVQYQGESVQTMIDYGCEFRVKPSKPSDKKAKGWVVI